MKHPIEDDILLAHATGRLSAGQVTALDAHLADCAECAQRLREIEAVCAHLPLDAVPPSVGFDVRLRARLDAIDEARVPWWRRAPGWAALPAAAGLAAVVALAVVDRPATEPTEPGLRAQTSDDPGRRLALSDDPRRSDDVVSAEGRPSDAESVEPPVVPEPELLADLALLEALDAVELVDVVDDLEAIASMPEEG